LLHVRVMLALHRHYLFNGITITQKVKHPQCLVRLVPTSAALWNVDVYKSDAMIHHEQ
jgi:hypothetical protein